jgi:hypothetical protein
MKCKNCAKQYFCKIKDIKERLEPINCKDFISWIYTKNYGEINKKNEINIEHTEKRMI